jgi:hypothetical protein
MGITSLSMSLRTLTPMLIEKDMNMFMGIILKCKLCVKCTTVQLKCSPMEQVSDEESAV